ncbi:carbohydrate ABC transporter permease [Paenibacillus sp. PAMC21692]|uniref:carbohydrate ABC transporter permease n=1 Tax=Paenibacillus sp. PAMC21692 TaxID=2762320 RepID=UPI0021C3BBE4|nr:sugar ABC transporter permease [Paenibacillus sp. PAMC21692]
MKRKSVGRFVVFASHGVAMYTVFIIVPIILSIVYSFTNINPLYPNWSFIGFRNYLDLFEDAGFWKALGNTVTLAILVTFACNALGIMIAMMLNFKGMLYNALRSMFFAPQILSAVIVGFIWSIILTNDGILNKILSLLHLEFLKESWLANPDLALYSVAAVIIWQMLGFSVVIYLATLQSIPKDLYEASDIDGGNRWDKFRHVTFPLLAPGITINIIMLLITVFKIYDQIAVLTAGGPGTATEVLAYKIVYTGFTKNEMGYGSSMSVMLFILIGLLSVISTTFLRKREVEH